MNRTARVTTGSCSRRQVLRSLIGASVGGGLAARLAAAGPDEELIGYWPLRDDAKDHSGHGLDGVEHGAARTDGRFDGRSSYVEIPPGAAFNLGRKDFTVAAWIRADDPALDITGDVVGLWDADRRKGFTLCVKGSAGGYNSHGSERNLHFGIDDADLGPWEDCGRPNLTSNYVSNSLTVFNGDLYAATSDATTPEQWCHVYRYAGGQEWEDCGRVGDGKTRGVGPMVVHDGRLCAATWSYDWVRVDKDDLDSCRVYRYAGGQEWEDLGQPGACRRLFGIASYAGRLFVVGDDNRCWVYEGDRTWIPSREFRSLVHPMAVHDGRLYVGEFGDGRQRDGSFRQAEVFTFDGQQWSSAGHPMGPDDREDQIHALHVYQGLLHATTWPRGKVAALEPDGSWRDCGRLGLSTESNALNVYNGKLYAGTIPRGEVYRFEGGTRWTRIGRFCPDELAEADDPRLSQRWGRVTSLTAYSGKLFASVGSYTSSIQDAPPDARGRVFAIRAGQSVSYDRDIGGEWRHLAAVRRGNRAELFLDGELVSHANGAADRYDLTSAAPLRIGFGPTDFFSGSIREVRLWATALDQARISTLAATAP